MHKRKISLALLGFVLTAKAFGSEQTPRPLPADVTADVLSTHNLIETGDTEENRNIMKFLTSKISLRQDMDDPNLYWKFVHFGTDAGARAGGLNPRKGSVDFQRTVSKWLKQLDSYLLESFNSRPASDSNYNNSVAEARAALAAPGVNVPVSAEDKLKSLLGRLSPDRYEIFEAAVIVASIDAGVPFDASTASLENLIRVMRESQKEVAGEVSLNIYRGFSEKELEWYGKYTKFLATKGIRIKTLATKNNKVTIMPSNQSSMTQSDDGKSANRAPSDTSFVATGIGQSIPLSVADNGGLISYVMDWQSYRSVADILNSKTVTGPVAWLPPVRIEGEFEYFAPPVTGTVSCNGSAVVKGGVERRELTKYSKDQPLVLDDDTQGLAVTDTTRVCHLSNVAGGSETMLYPQFKAIESEFMNQFSRQVEASMQAKKAIFNQMLSSTTAQWDAYNPVGSIEKPDLAAVQKCEPNIVEHCHYKPKNRGLSKSTKVCNTVQEGETCKSVLEWVNKTFETLTPLRVVIEQKPFSEIVALNLNRNISTTDGTLRNFRVTMGSKPLCVTGKPALNDEYVVEMIGCQDPVQQVEGQLASQEETRGGVVTPVSRRGDGD